MRGRIPLTTAIFIKRANEIHNRFYDYSLVNYVNAKTKVIIKCPIHGEFLQRPDSHLDGKGCLQCLNREINANFNKKTTEQFIEEAKLIHGDKYNYSLVNYKNNRTKIIIICSIHGKFLQTPNAHLKGCGCQVCNKSKQGRKPKTTDQFIKEATKVHNNKYNYALVKYKNSQTKIRIICFAHGEFLQTPNAHLSGRGCPNCYLDKNKE